MPALDRPPQLVPPTAAVRDSFLAGERADRLTEDVTGDWARTVDAAAADGVLAPNAPFGPAPTDGR